jgi:Rrf2 family transcriptional regulator, iron-sulfur cluster assembly transcription factor
MRMSTKSRFAVDAMIDLALRERAGPVTLAAISSRLQVSLSYLEQLFSRLKREGLVVSTRGPGGGYTLGREAGAISVADIIGAIDDVPEQDERQASAPRRPEMTASLWAGLHEAMLRHMATISLQSLVDDQVASGTVIENRPPRRAISAQPVVQPVRTSAPNSVFALGQAIGRSFAR